MKAVVRAADTGAADLRSFRGKRAAAHVFDSVLELVGRFACHVGDDVVKLPAPPCHARDQQRRLSLGTLRIGAAHATTSAACPGATCGARDSRRSDEHVYIIVIVQICELGLCCGRRSARTKRIRALRAVTGIAGGPAEVLCLLECATDK